MPGAVWRDGGAVSKPRVGELWLHRDDPSVRAVVIERYWRRETPDAEQVWGVAVALQSMASLTYFFETVFLEFFVRAPRPPTDAVFTKDGYYLPNGAGLRLRDEDEP